MEKQGCLWQRFPSEDEAISSCKGLAFWDFRVCPTELTWNLNLRFSRNLDPFGAPQKRGSCGLEIHRSGSAWGPSFRCGSLLT